MRPSPEFLRCCKARPHGGEGKVQIGRAVLACFCLPTTTPQANRSGFSIARGQAPLHLAVVTAFQKFDRITSGSMRSYTQTRRWTFSGGVITSFWDAVSG